MLKEWYLLLDSVLLFGIYLTGSNCQEERLNIVVSRLYIEASLEVH